MKTVFLLAAVLGACAAPGEVEDRSLFSFGLIADVQYADKATAGRRAYRDALPLVQSCSADLAQRDLAFVVQLGDIIDGRESLEGSTADLEQVLAPLEATGHELLHVIGNHCMSVPRPLLEKRLGLERGWYSRARDGWRFIVLDSMALSIHGDSAEAGRTWLDAHPRSDYPNASEWNGGFGSEQLQWLSEQLKSAEFANENVVLFAHHPVFAGASTPAHLAWDYAEARALLESSPATLAYFSGHDHAGGYARHAGVHYWTLPAMLEARAPSNAYAIVEVRADSLVVNGIGDVADRVLAR